MKRSRPIKVAVDMDGVMADFLSGFNKLEGTETEKWDHIFSTPGFWLGLDPLASRGDVTLLNGLALRSDVWFVTARPTKWARAETEEWLRDHNVLDPSVVTCERTNVKPSLLKAMGIHAVLDDQVAAVTGCGASVVRLVRAPYNEGQLALSGYVDGVGEFVRQVFEKFFKEMK